MSVLLTDILFNALFIGIGVIEVASTFDGTEELKVDAKCFEDLLADDELLVSEAVNNDVTNVEVVRADAFTVVTAFGEPFKLFALEFSLTDRLE